MEKQPDPKPGLEDVAKHVLADMQFRVETGKKKYGTTLQTFNGRDALMDAYEEALDMCMYLKQAILERDEYRSRWLTCAQKASQESINRVEGDVDLTKVTFIPPPRDNKRVIIHVDGSKMTPGELAQLINDAREKIL